MASRIQKLMNDLGFRTESMPLLIYIKITYFLKGFDTLVVCSRTLGEDARLTPLLTRIGQVFTRNAEIVELRGRGGFHDAFPVDLINEFGADLKSLEVEMDECYTTLSNSPHSRIPALIDVIEIIDSVVEDLQNFHCLEFSDIGDDTEGMEEKLQLFRNFIEFVEMLNVDDQQLELEGFVTQVATVAVNAAHVCARLHGLFDSWNEQGWKQVKHGWKQIQPQILALLQRIRPVGVEVSQAYKNALSISKSSEELRYSMDLDPALYSLVLVIKDFIDFLLWCLWETLELDYSLDDSMKDTVRPLWVGLKFLREQLKFDEEIVRMAICDAGIVICTLHHQDSGVADLVKMFDMIMIDAEDQIPDSSRLDMKVEAEERITETSRLKSEVDLPPTSVLRFFNCLLDSLMESKNFDDTKTVKQDLVYLTSSLNLLMELGNQQVEDSQVQLLWNCAKKVAVSCKTLWDHMVARNIPGSVLQLVDSISKDIGIFRENFSAVYPGRTLEASEGISVDIQDGFMITESIRTRQADTSLIMPEVRPQCSVLATDRVAGITEEVTSMLGKLTTGSVYLHITPIVGMAGLGKTTLALQLYNHPSVIHHFQCRAWITISQVYSINKLLLELLYQIHPDWFSVYITMKDEYLVNQIKLFLTRKRYLICLDDVWDLTVWKCLMECFPSEYFGSRILVTSRVRDVIPRSMNREEHYLLRHRSDFESLEILKTTLFPVDNFPVILNELGMQIAESCKGLPMTVVAVAGLLTTPKPEVWQKVLESLNSNALSITDKFINSFELSYRHLPVHLKLCFLYFSMFQEGEEVSAMSLYLLWFAEGLIHEDKWNKKGDIALRYMEGLVMESLVIVTKRSALGEVKTCRVHEIIHEFCIKKAKEEAFSDFLKGYDDILAVNELRGSQRLCIQSSRRDFKCLRLSRPNIQSLLFLPPKDALPRVVDDVSFIVRVFKSLRVLHIREMELGEVFPVEMKLLVQLRYLAVRGHFVYLPSSIGNLLNLETLIVDAHLEIALPGTIWDLHKLRYLCVKNGFSFSPDDSSQLLQLEKCSVVIVESWDILEMLLKKFPNVSNLKLKCRHQLDRAPAPSHHIEFSFASNLQRLTLKDLELNDSGISAVGTLPSLERLKLLHVSFCGGGLHMEEGIFFSELKYFKLSDSNIRRWTATNGNLHYLKMLVLQGCPCLEEIPTDCLNFGPFLQEIEVFDCSPAAELQVREIGEMQRDFGNDAIKVTISGIPA